MPKYLRFLSLILALSLLLSLAACGGAVPTEPAVTDTPTEVPTEVPTEAPTEPPLPDFGVYPDVQDFVGQDAGEALIHLWGEDTVSFQPGAAEDGSDIILGPHPYNWEIWTFEPELKENVWAYIELLNEDIFHLEQVYYRALETKWVYLYRYTGSCPVYAAEVSGFVPADGGEYHLCITINDDPSITNQIGLEIAVGYGLEAISRETYGSILSGEEYVCTDAWVEQFADPETYLDYRCTICDTPLSAEEVARKGNDEIVYCDRCYQERYG